MATTQNTFNGTGSNLGPFTFTFKWIQTSDIKVSVGGVLKTAGTHYNLQNLNYTTKTGGQVLFTAGNAPPIGTNNIRIYRDTSNDTLASTFSSGSAIRAADLNTNFTQTLHAVQEIDNNAVNIDGSNQMVGDLDMGGYQINNLAEPTVDDDAATKYYIDQRFGVTNIPAHTRWRKTATAGQTTFSGTGDYGGSLTYSALREQVYLNGALQQRSADYTADNGTSIVFSVPLTVGDVVDVVCVNNTNTSGISNAANLSYSGQFSGQTVRTVAAKLADVVSVKDFGAVGDGVTDDTAAIQAAIDAANASGSRTIVSLGGKTYRTVGEIFIKTHAILKDGTIKFDPSSNDKIAINIGTKNGQYLVRVGGVENVVVNASTSTWSNLTGFNFGHLARECFVSYCRAEMNNGLPPSTDRNHVGFSIYGNKDSTVVTGSGIYQNTILGCSAYACKFGYLLDTAGYGEVGYAPQANGNWLSCCNAYSCYTGAIYVGYGAQDNHIEVRADTFATQLGTGTTIKVCQIFGSYNIIDIAEEIGTRADTQYTVAIEGANARYNEVSYATQQIGTAAYLLNTTGSAVGKNVITDKGRCQALNGGDLITISGYASATAGSNPTIDGFVAPKKCVLIAASAQNVLTPTSYTRLNFAKSNATDTVQRLTWDNTDAPYTTKSLNTDPTSSGTINSNFVYAAGERCVVTLAQDPSGGQQVFYTITFKVLAP